MLSKLQTNFGKLKSSFKIKGCLLEVVSLFYTLKLIDNSWVLFRSVIYKARVSRANAHSELCPFVIVVLIESLVLWTLFKSYDRGYKMVWYPYLVNPKANRT